MQIYEQYVVRNKARDAFYINCSYQEGDEAAEMTGNMVLNSFMLK